MNPRPLGPEDLAGNSTGGFGHIWCCLLREWLLSKPLHSNTSIRSPCGLGHRLGLDRNPRPLNSLKKSAGIVLRSQQDGLDRIIHRASQLPEHCHSVLIIAGNLIYHHGNIDITVYRDGPSCTGAVQKKGSSVYSLPRKRRTYLRKCKRLEKVPSPKKLIEKICCAIINEDPLQPERQQPLPTCYRPAHTLIQAF